jgi:hypothetical protein
MLPDGLEDDGTLYCISCGNVIWPAARPGEITLGAM